jgi:dihydrofolate synthase/folylpolyglutamate synthase
VVPQQPRASSHAELESLVPATYAGKTVRSTVEGLFPAPGTCTAGGKGDVIVVTGSIYLLGEVLARLEPERGRGEGRLQDF